MYKVTMKKGYNEFDFKFDSLRDALDFITTSLGKSMDEIRFLIEVIKEEEESEEEEC